MRKQKRRSGFTLAELLIVIAIMGILSAVGIISVSRYQKSLTSLEFDDTAKEIFIAAQNHLAIAESQGYLDKKIVSGNDLQYFVVNNNEIKDTNDNGNKDLKSLLPLMLPDGAIDASILSGSSYIIQYQLHPAVVKNVFYSSPTTRHLGRSLGCNFDSDSYSEIFDGEITYTGDTNKANRQKYEDRYVIGWYGGGEDAKQGELIDAPSISVINAEKLYVKIDDPNILKNSGKINYSLYISRESDSGDPVILELSGTSPRITTKSEGTISDRIIYVTLDDVTSSGMGFVDLGLSGYVRGENVVVQAVAYSEEGFSNYAYSEKVVVNSLFADVIFDTTDGKTKQKGIAYISNFRHFENLNQITDTSQIVSAEQTRDLKWTKATKGDEKEEDGFVETILALDAESGINGRSASSIFYTPVVTKTALSYDGSNNRIWNVRYDGVDSNPAGLFSNLCTGYIVKNLTLVDFEISGAGDIGALAGQATNATITNVIARNTEADTSATITSASRNAGGLIGVMTDGSIDKCAAALVVSGSTNAGGLVGQASDGTISRCYSGGHTKDGKYDLVKDDENNIIYNVKASSGNAGGLVGTTTGTSITGSYSTCSVSGTVSVGGVIGTTSGGTILQSYSTGLIDRMPGIEKAGTFIGIVESSTSLGNKGSNNYFDIINEYTESDGTIKYLSAIGSASSSDLVTAFDADVNTYNTFVSGANPQADPYDSILRTYYNGEYPLKGIDGVNNTDLVSTHFGDWPAPETFVINTPTSTPSGSGTGD